MCIVISGGKGSKLWQGLRSVEILAHHHNKRKVEILFLLFLENKNKGNSLLMLHPGNAHCELIEPWDKDCGLPYHVDEAKDSEYRSVLQSIYHKMFRYDDSNNKLYQKEQLNPNESWYGLEAEKEVSIWPNDEKWFARGGYKKGINELYGTEKDKERFIPFTTWKLGPFSKEGLVLLAFKIWFQDKSYEQLVGNRVYFPVDGPDRLRSKIKHDFIPFYMGDEQDAWQDRLKLFEDYVNFERSYDIIILKEPDPPNGYTVGFDLDGSCMIARAADDRQPEQKGIAERYVTMDDRFKLNLYYKEEISCRKNRLRHATLGPKNSSDVRDNE